MINLKNLTDIELIKLRDERITEIQEILSDLAAIKSEKNLSHVSKQEKKEDAEYRSEALERKTILDNELRTIKAAIKERNIAKSGAEGSFADHAKEISKKLDTIIFLMGGGGTSD